jgi:hypothetical protein
MTKSRITLLTILSTLLAIPIAYAQNPHFKSPGSGLTVTFSAAQETIRIQGEFAGLGNSKSVDFDVVALGTTEGTCTNPGGGVPQGQEVALDIDTTVPVPVTKSGTATLNAPFGLDFSCKSKKMTAAVTGVTVTELEVTVQDTTFTCTIPGGELVLDQSNTSEELTCEPS